MKLRRYYYPQATEAIIRSVMTELDRGATIIKGMGVIQERTETSLYCSRPVPAYLENSQELTPVPLLL